MKSKKIAFLGIVLLTVFALSAIQQTQAATKIFDYTWYGESPAIMGPVHVSLQIRVYSDQEVKVTATFSKDPEAYGVFFELLEVWVQGVYWENEQVDVPTSGGTATVSEYGDSELWGQSPIARLNIVAGLKFTVSQVVFYATQGLVVFYSGFGFSAFEEVEFLDALGYANMRRGPRYW